MCISTRTLYHIDSFSNSFSTTRSLSMASSSLAGYVCLVTGATRGIGKGIAVQLGEKGAKVYVTGRTLDTPAGATTTGSLRDTAKEIEARGGVCVPVQCDHTKDDEVERLFEQIKRENDGRLDILVNNAFSAVNAIFSNMGKPYWEQPVSMWDQVNAVGLRNHYICAVYAARSMVLQGTGLIVNISSGGGLRYLFNVSYGIGKEACDRMAADCGYELRKSNVAFVSLWPGAVGTEESLRLLNSAVETSKELKDIGIRSDPQKSLETFEKGETPEFVGKCVAALAMDTNIMKKSGKILLTYDLAKEYGLSDVEGHEPMDMRRVNVLLEATGHTVLAALVPGFVRLPNWMMCLGGNKFK